MAHDGNGAGPERRRPEYRTGDIFAESWRVEALVNPVNCVGVAGRGLALRFKQLYPENFRAYAAACKRRELRPGRMFVFETGVDYPRYILNFPTKRHWRDPSRLEDIRVGLVALVEEVRGRGIRSIAVPALGCGLGGLEWEEVHPLLETALAQVEHVKAVVFRPGAIG